jgi:hypothetical protein
MSEQPDPTQGIPELSTPQEEDPSYRGDLAQEESFLIGQHQAAIQRTQLGIASLEEQKWRLMVELDGLRKGLERAYAQVEERLGLTQGQPWKMVQNRVYQAPSERPQPGHVPTSMESGPKE